MRLTEKTDSGSWCLRDVPWDDLKPGAAITEKNWRKIYGVLWKLKDYEDSGKTPEEVKKLISQQVKMTIHFDECWTPVTERLPEEHDSIFKYLKGTPKWRKPMFEKRSDNVLVTVKYEDGTVRTEQAHTIDGIWKTKNKACTSTVIAWKPMPEPYREEKNE